MRLILLASAALLTLAGCDQMGPAYNRADAASPGIYAPRTEGSGSSILRNDSTTTPRERAEQGCASGEQADMLHQNRPGGTDYSPARCRMQGY